MGTKTGRLLLGAHRGAELLHPCIQLRIICHLCGGEVQDWHVSIAAQQLAHGICIAFFGRAGDDDAGDARARKLGTVVALEVLSGAAIFPHQMGPATTTRS